MRDEALKIEISRVHQGNYSVYGLVRLWCALKLEGIDIARCTTQRLMAELGIRGVRRGKTYVTTTIANELAEQPKDLVNRNFVSGGPNRLWLADTTYVKTKIGWAYVAFVTDVFSRAIVGRKVSASLKNSLATGALEMAITQRVERSGNLIHHSDLGVQHLSVKYSQRLLDAGITASVGSSRLMPMTMPRLRRSTGCTRPRW